MSDLSAKYKKIMNNIEKKITNKEDLEYIKEQVYAITALFLDELDKLIEISETKMQDLVSNQLELQEKINKIESSVDEIEKDIYVENDEEFDFEITCPYCNKDFVTELNEAKQEVICPECKNVIELDWNMEEDGCSGCGGACHEHHHNETDEDM